MPKKLFLGGLLCQIQECAECFLVGDCQIGKRLAVERHPRFLQTVHEDRVGETLPADGGVDPADPERTKVALADAPVGTHTPWI